MSFFSVELTSTDLCGSLLLEALRRSSSVDQFVVGDVLPSLWKCSFVMRCLPSQICVVPSRGLGGWKVLVFSAFFFSQKVLVFALYRNPWGRKPLAASGAQHLDCGVGERWKGLQWFFWILFKFFVLLAHGESQESWISASVFFFLGVFWIGCIELASCKYWELTGDHQRLGVTGSCLFFFWFSCVGVVSISWRIAFRSCSSCCCKCEFLQGEEDWEKKTGRSRGVGSTKGTRSCCKSDVGGG